MVILLVISAIVTAICLPLVDYACQETTWP
jgi:hypothetical protein